VRSHADEAGHSRAHKRARSEPFSLPRAHTSLLDLTQVAQSTHTHGSSELNWGTYARTAIDDDDQSDA
jgi:hypothetical protein